MKRRSEIKQLLAVAVTASTMLAAGAARAEWSIGGGFESFKWKESTSPSVEESGLRYSLNLTWAQSKAPGLSAGYFLKTYTGNPDYDGATLFGGVPVNAEVHYRGLVNEVQAWYRMPNNFDILLAFGPITGLTPSGRRPRMPFMYSSTRLRAQYTSVPSSKMT